MYKLRSIFEVDFLNKLFLVKLKSILEFIIIIFLFNVDAKNKVKNYNKKEIIAYIINYNMYNLKYYFVSEKVKKYK